MSSSGKIRRLLQILEYLQSGRRFHAGQLSDFLKVSKRTVFRDLRILQDSGIQLLYDETEQGYWLPPSTFLPPTDLTVNETLSLLLLGEKLGGTAGIPFQGAAQTAVVKLTANLPDALRAHVSRLSERLHISLEPKSSVPASQEHYQRCLDAIEKRYKIRFHYDCLTDEQRLTTLVSPYEVFFQKRAWYVVGRSSLHRQVRTFHIGRILSSTLTTDSYEIPPRFSLKKYFGNAWRMIREKPMVEVVIRMKPKVAKNVAEVLWHRTQKVVWNPDGSLNFHVTVEGIREISWWILGYGDQAEVLAPRELRDLIAFHAQRMVAVYHPSTPTADPPKPAKKARQKSAAPAKKVSKKRVPRR